MVAIFRLHSLLSLITILVAAPTSQGSVPCMETMADLYTSKLMKWRNLEVAISVSNFRDKDSILRPKKIDWVVKLIEQAHLLTLVKVHHSKTRRLICRVVRRRAEHLLKPRLIPTCHTHQKRCKV